MEPPEGEENSSSMSMRGASSTVIPSWLLASAGDDSALRNAAVASLLAARLPSSTRTSMFTLAEVTTGTLTVSMATPAMSETWPLMESFSASS